MAPMLVKCFGECERVDTFELVLNHTQALKNVCNRMTKKTNENKEIKSFLSLFYIHYLKITAHQSSHVTKSSLPPLPHLTYPPPPPSLSSHEPSRPTTGNEPESITSFPPTVDGTCNGTATTTRTPRRNPTLMALGVKWSD